ncbi:PLP-dependent transferase [Macroventuria anomochaeta]|uniref:PLP-dependent transferase n=1 Tax=Macroventuria anomochaeta TaxID=301207 RepID=A0ACB6S2H2_9PLEO|nr:PLP-dependent transferase [Macroventuria anomochaeta]KAF2627593.1 PLP-dependent transferase [Macroventuria anomochaeta]
MSTPALSIRGTTASVNYPKDFALWNIISNLWDPESNPDGYVSLGLAENALMHNELRDFLNSQKLLDPQAVGFTYGSGPYGSKNVRATIAKFMNHHFKPARQLQPDQVLVTNGVSVAIEHCAWGLANPGEGILLGRPYYRAFLPDISMRTGVNVVPVSFGSADPCNIDCVHAYESALLRSNEQGIPIRALMLCHPHNPLGRCYSRETLIALLHLCQKYKIHLISDEIYALTVWENTIDSTGPAPIPFSSVLSIDLPSIIDPSLVHVLWGMSKDFGANGLRLGTIVSPSNPAFIQACRACGIWSSPSSLAENAVCHVLNDKAFVESYIRLNKKRLSVAYTHVITELKNNGIEYNPGANAAFFVLVNLGKMFRENFTAGFEEGQLVDDVGITAKVHERLMAKKVYLVDGDAAGVEEPGWFRLVFTQPQELVSEAIGRVAAALKA